MHDWQVALHSVSQQTPSTQNPETHWPAAAQATPPPSFGMHTGALQKLPATQPASPVHAPAHEVVLAHRYGAQSSVAGTHWPWSLQVADVTAPSLQLGVEQTVPAGWI